MTRIPSPSTTVSTRPEVARSPSRPDPNRLAALLVQVWLEVRQGQRPFSQLRPLVTPALQRQLVTLLRRHIRQGPSAPGKVVRVVSCQLNDETFEASVLVRHGDRTTAIAVRLERYQGAWRAAEMTAPEAGFTPLLTASQPQRRRPRRDAFDEVLGTPL